MTWTEGYIVEIDYTYGYYRELNPGVLRYALLNAGQRSRAIEKPRYLELGFGQGLSLNVHAAATPGEYWGTDFNPSHAAGAQTLAAASGANVTLLDGSFEELKSSADLPQFDVINLHGVWSWISDENRRHITEIIRKRLLPGGVVYISYNCTPGWSAAMPLRHLLTLHAELAESDASGIVSRINGALGFAQQVVDSGALFFRANPAVAERLKKITEQDRKYVAHEYLSADWHPMPFSELAGWMDRAKLGFAASAHLLDHVDAINLNETGQKLLTETQHPILRESLRDYLVNQQFRRDIFVRGTRQFAPLERLDAIRGLELALLTPADEIAMKVPGALGEATLQEAIYRPIVDQLSEMLALSPDAAGAESTHCIAALEKRLLKSTHSVNLPQLLQAICVLVGAGHVTVAQSAAAQAQASSHCSALNRYLCHRARDSADIRFLASPVTGGGIPVDRIEQLFLLAAESGEQDADGRARFVWNILAAQGQRLLRESKPIDSPQENLAQLEASAKSFGEKRAPLLRRLGVSLS